MSLISNQTKYGRINGANCTTDQWNENNDMERYSTHNEGNLLFLKDFLEP